MHRQCQFLLSSLKPRTCHGNSVRFVTISHTVSAEMTTPQRAPTATDLGGISLKLPNSQGLDGKQQPFTFGARLAERRRQIALLQDAGINTLPIDTLSRDKPIDVQQQQTSPTRDRSTYRQNRPRTERPRSENKPEQRQYAQRSPRPQQSRDDQERSTRPERRYPPPPTDGRRNAGERRGPPQRTSPRRRRQKPADITGGVEIPEDLESERSRETEDNPKVSSRMVSEDITNLLRAFNNSHLTSRYTADVMRDNTNYLREDVSSHPELMLDTYVSFQPRDVRGDKRAVVTNAMLRMSRHKELNQKARNDALKVVKRYADAGLKRPAVEQKKKKKKQKA